MKLSSEYSLSLACSTGRIAGYNARVDTSLHNGLPRAKKPAQNETSTGLQNVTVPLGSEGRVGVMGASVPSWMDSSSKQPCGKRAKLAAVSGHLPERRTQSVVCCCHKLSMSLALTLCKGKVILLPALNWLTQLIHKTKEIGFSPLLGAGGGTFFFPLQCP